MSPAELKRIRHALGLSAEACGRLLGVNGRQIRRWEAGDHPIAPLAITVLDLIITLPAVRDHLGLTLDHTKLAA